MLYKEITWWPGAFHVFVIKKDKKTQKDKQERIGIVQRRIVRINGKIDRAIWVAYNRHFFEIKGEFDTRTDAAQAIPKGAIHQNVNAFSGH